MRILQIHKYYSRKKGGGSVTAFFQTKELLEKKGHRVIVFSMDDPENEPSKFSPYFAEHFDINQAKGWNKIKYAWRSIWNREAQSKLAKLIEDERPDVAHLHNIYHYLTPAIIHTLKIHKIPIVFKLSDYKLICPNYKLFVKGKPCERCKGGRYYYCWLNKCLKNSSGISFVAMLEAYWHRWKSSYDLVDFFLAPSNFMKKKCQEFGVLPARIILLRNVMNLSGFENLGEWREDNYFVYYGRLSEEKGIIDLIRAVKELSGKTEINQNKLYIVGKGPQEETLKKLTKDLGLQKQINFLGFKEGRELKEIIRRSKFVVLPSVWYDNSPLVISEAGLMEKPVIVSDRGGSLEMVRDGDTGFVYEGGNVKRLFYKIEKILNLSQEERKRMGQEGREFIQRLNNEENYYNHLMSIYNELVIKNQ